MHSVRYLILIVLICVTPLGYMARAAEDLATSPAGLWQTIDDKSGEARSIVRIWIDGNELQGKIEKIYPKPNIPPNPTCDKCPGEFKGKPVLGMTFMWGFRLEKDTWKGGKALDAESGKIYDCQIRLLPGGERLDLYGYITVVFKIGRHQTWKRVDESLLGQ
jgi:uncharacterized protein (DUF2147 family)